MSSWLTLRAHESRRYLPLNHNPFHFTERDLIGASIIEARRTGTFMVGHLLGNVELPTFRSYSVILVARKEGLPILQASHLGSVRYHPNPVSTPI